jgi:hypothetical protein
MRFPENRENNREFSKFTFLARPFSAFMKTGLAQGIHKGTIL